LAAARKEHAAKDQPNNNADYCENAAPYNRHQAEERDKRSLHTEVRK
jgi:hypothetical protein